MKILLYNKNYKYQFITMEFLDKKLIIYKNNKILKYSTYKGKINFYLKK